MDFTPSAKSQQLLQKLEQFFDDYIYPNEAQYARQLHDAENRFAALPLIDELKTKARAAGLWNLFVPPSHAEYCEHGGLSFSDYAPLAEVMGRVQWSPEVFNCNAPDTGNMEVLMNFGTEAQKDRWLTPLLNGEIRSSYAMTEPQVASSDATNIELRIERDGDEWALNGRKWFITGAMYERTKIFIVMGKSDPDNPNRHQQQTQVLVPKDTAGLEIIRPLSKHQSVREDISKSFSEVEMARLLVLKTCDKIDREGVAESIDMIAATKTTVPLLVQNLIDRCMQLHGAGGLTEDYFMAEAFNYARWCRQADGPDQVHQMALGKKIIDRYSA